MPGPLHGMPLTALYQPLGPIDQKRLAARKANTTYCYDFPLVIPKLYSYITTMFSFSFVCIKTILKFLTSLKINVLCAGV